MLRYFLEHKINAKISPVRVISASMIHGIMVNKCICAFNGLAISVSQARKMSVLSAGPSELTLVVSCDQSNQRSIHLSF